MFYKEFKNCIIGVGDNIPALLLFQTDNELQERIMDGCWFDDQIFKYEYDGQLIDGVYSCKIDVYHNVLMEYDELVLRNFKLLIEYK